MTFIESKLTHSSVDRYLIAMASPDYSSFSPRFTRLTLLFFVGLVSVVHVCAGVQNATDRLDICPKNITSSEACERDVINCCANGTCPSGYYEITICNASCNATGHLTDSSAGDSSFAVIFCMVCANGCNGSNWEDCAELENGNNCTKNSNVTDNDHPLTIGIIVVIVVGGVAFIVLVVVVGVIICKRVRSRNTPKNTSVEESDQEGAGHSAYEEDDNDIQKESGRPKESLREQISQNHDKIFRYVPDPTENIPQKPQRPEDERKSGLYVNQRSVEFVQKIYQQQPQKATPVTKGKKKKAVKGDPIYENASPEQLEIDMLPIAPVPPMPEHASPPQDAGLSKGPAYVGDTSDSLQGQMGSSSASSMSVLRKGPGYQGGEETEDTGGKISPLPFAKSQANTRKKQQKSNASSNKGDILRGPAYKNSEEGEIPGVSEGADALSGLSKGPGYHVDQKYYGNEEVAGSAEKRQPKQHKDLKATKPKGINKGKAAVEDSDREDYEEICPPDAPLYENFGFNS